MGYPTTTQDSLPVAGQALLDGIPTRKVPMKGFKVVVYISFPFPKLSWRKRCNQCAEDRELPGLLAEKIGPSGLATAHRSDLLWGPWSNRFQPFKTDSRHRLR